MARIYQNAHLCIHASCAPDEDSGFLKSRAISRAGIQPVWLRFGFRSLKLPTKGCIDDATGSQDSDAGYILLPSLATPNSEDHGEFGRLGHRGWVLQERVLSRRVAFSSETLVSWTCQNSRADELYTNMDNYIRQWHQAPVALGRTDWKMDRLWHRIVLEYTRMELTYARDTLWALAGLTREMRINSLAHIQGEEYYAGSLEIDIAARSLLESCPQREAAAKVPRRLCRPFVVLGCSPRSRGLARHGETATVPRHDLRRARHPREP